MSELSNANYNKEEVSNLMEVCRRLNPLVREEQTKEEEYMRSALEGNKNLEKEKTSNNSKNDNS